MSNFHRGALRSICVQFIGVVPIRHICVNFPPKKPTGRIYFIILFTISYFFDNISYSFRDGATLPAVKSASRKARIGEIPIPTVESGWEKGKKYFLYRWINFHRASLPPPEWMGIYATERWILYVYRFSRGAQRAWIYLSQPNGRRGNCKEW